MTSFTSRYGNPAVDYKGAHIWAHCRHTVKVVAVAGRVDAANVDGVTGFVLHTVAADTPIVLDLGAVTAFTPAGLQLLSAVDERCSHIGADWALVVSDAVSRRLKADAARYPVVGSAAGAEHQIDDDILARRTMLLPLLSRTA
jgi:anti-anti-sigma regulatory factor